MKDKQPEVAVAWRIGQGLWTRYYAAVHETIRAFHWSQQAQSLVAAFSGKFFFPLELYANLS